MKNPALNKFLQFSLFFGAIILYWNFQDQQDFDKVFKVVQGKLTSPVAVTDVRDLFYINGEGWRKTREELGSERWQAALDSIIKPIRQNQLQAFNDTFPEVNEDIWRKYVEWFNEKAIKLDTFLVKYGKDTFWLDIEQKAVFNADYVFRIENEPYEFKVDIAETPWYEGDMFDTLPRSEQLDLMLESDIDKPMRYSDFEKHVAFVDDFLEGQEMIKVSIRDYREDHRKALLEGRSIEASAYLVEKPSGWNLYKDESGFEVLAMFDEYISWWDSIFHQILFWFFLIVWLFLAFSSWATHSYNKEQAIEEAAENTP
jgi:hypothetical protein